MVDWKLPWDGGCMCGRVRLRVSRPPLLTMACHCTGCQKFSASAFSLTMALPSDGFAVTGGELAIGGMHGPHRQWFCAHCKNWVYTQPHGLDFFVIASQALFNDIVAHAMRQFDQHAQCAAFWYVVRCDPKTYDASVQARSISKEELAGLAVHGGG